MELKKNWNSNGNIAGGDRLQLRGFCLGQTDSTCTTCTPKKQKYKIKKINVFPLTAWSKVWENTTTGSRINLEYKDPTFLR